MIPVEAHSDDYAVQVAFDATPWFEQALDQEILDLAKCEWGGDWPADAVAQWAAEQAETSGKDAGLLQLFNYLDIIRDDWMKKDCCGFECHVEEKPALAWLAAHRPELYSRLSLELLA